MFVCVCVCFVGSCIAFFGESRLYLLKAIIEASPRYDLVNCGWAESGTWNARVFESLVF